MPTPPPSEPSEVADLIVTWSGLVLAGFTFLLTVFTAIIVVAGIFGLREIKNIRQAGEQFRSQANAHLTEARDLLERLRSEVEGIDGRMNSLVEVSYLFNQGELAYREGEYVKAVEFLGRAATLDPRNARVLYRLGRSLTNLGDDVAAPERFKEMQQLGTHPGDAERGLALVYRYTDQRLALRYGREAVEVAGWHAPNWNCLGLILRDRHDLDEARAAHERAADLDPQNATTAFYLALLEAHRDPQRALEECRVAVYRLSRQEEAGQMKSMWGQMIRWGECVLAGRYAQADDFTRLLAETCPSRRRARELCGHMDFLLRALTREELRDRYLRPIETRWPPRVGE